MIESKALLNSYRAVVLQVVSINVNSYKNHIVTRISSTGLLVTLLLNLYPLSLYAVESMSLSNRLYDAYGIELFGFTDTRWGTRLVDDAHEKDMSTGEGRLQLELNRDFDQFLLKFKGDIIGDAVTEEVDVDIRDFSMTFTPADFLDISLGRMVSTWGTGDLIFINDMFPKDWQSFFIGRNDAYLKQASNSIKTGIFLEDYSIDVVYTPLFQASEYVSGKRLSYYNPVAGELVGRNMILHDSKPNRYFSDGEISGRLARHFGGVEVALYGYSGFWQEPEGMDPVSGKATYPRLNVWGASIRSSLLGGIGNIEAGYYDSIQDDNGRNPFVRPSEYRFLSGFERELAHELTGGFQYYLETINHYRTYEQALPSSMHCRDKYRHLLTTRLTQLLMEQNLTLSLFIYYSPSDNDIYIRPKFSYKLTDNWTVDGGCNLFWGENDYTFWGRFQDNTNGYAGLRYNF
jgi:hypothetical protein